MFGRAGGRVGDARVREDLADAVAQAARAQPVLRALDQGLGRDDVDERAGLDAACCRARPARRGRTRAAGGERGKEREDAASGPSSMRSRSSRGKLRARRPAGAPAVRSLTLGGRQKARGHLRLRHGDHVPEAVDQDHVVGRRAAPGRAPRPRRRPQVSTERREELPVGLSDALPFAGSRPRILRDARAPHSGKRQRRSGRCACRRRGSPTPRRGCSRRRPRPGCTTTPLRPQTGQRATVPSKLFREPSGSSVKSRA